MSTITKHEVTETVHNIWFDDDVWVCIDEAGTDGVGSWEYQEGDFEDTYWEGSFWVDDDNTKLITDFDGISELPCRVCEALEAIGYDCTELKVEDLP